MKFSSNYILSESEKRMVIGLLMSKASVISKPSRSYTKHGPFIIALLKELDWNMDKTLRILNIGCSNSDQAPTVSRTALRVLIEVIREAIVLSHYQEYMTEDGHIKFNEMVNSERFRLAYIPRYKATRILRDYNVDYKRRRGRS